MSKNKSHEKYFLLMIATAIAINLCVVLVFYVKLQKANETIHSFEEKKSHLVDFPEQNEMSQSWTSSTPSSAKAVWLAGIIIDTNMISNEIWNVMFELNCQHGVGIHIISKRAYGIEEGFQKRNKFLNTTKTRNSSNNDTVCGPLIIHQEEEEEETSTLWNNQHYDKNRIDRISILRDHQRTLLKKEFFNNENYNSNDNNIPSIKEGVVILVDLDLLLIPTADEIWNQTQLLQRATYPHDSICALGTKVNFFQKTSNDETNDKNMNKNVIPIPFYYDTYATVFLNDTFTHPLSRRLFPSHYQGEDPKLVRSDDSKHGSFTQVHIWKYFQAKGRMSDTGNVQVRSCFGGLTMYKSKVYFDSNCEYKLDVKIIDEIENMSIDTTRSKSNTIMRYANSKERRPCEHVVIHDCFVRNVPGFNIALNPKLMTVWRRSSR